MIKLTEILNEGSSWLSSNVLNALVKELKRTEPKMSRNSEFVKGFTNYLKDIGNMKYSDLGQKRFKHLEKATDTIIAKTDALGSTNDKVNYKYIKNQLDGPVYAMLKKNRYDLEELTEVVKLPIEIGDTILTGKFKNKSREVKEFGQDKNGQPTINGMKMLAFRIKKLIPGKETVSEAIPPGHHKMPDGEVMADKDHVEEGKPMFQKTPNEIAYIDFKKWAYSNRSTVKGILLKAMKESSDTGTALFLALRQVWLAWANKKAKEWSSIPNKGPQGKDFGRALAVMLKKDNMIIQRSTNKLTDIK